MIKVIYDTNVYIDWAANKIDDDVLFRKEECIFISSVVIMELRAGAFTSKAISDIDKLFKTARKTTRFVTPTLYDYLKAGEILSLLKNEKNYDIRGLRYITNDILIALTARQIGSTLRTFNTDDFKTISYYLDFKWESPV
ncbi:type II toxin-antitoxin system VapC family toxin [Candidatus Magnetobacterium casense]|uniref:Type II toxin-antitoxin system VapC family toxin n=1 Tax=Candidatus Magnetobacterium casense TaxID=1455061 RepID=A0ABS6RZC3_9BACT|nr:type II toxin-antitoxin system VapC family toxin [Candidatus Magnetobacterium casensis]MBV6341946.1 type II toxin-antitoxin system VapC family toxin [Candidatus Magnetobacterium casensis]